VQGTDTSGAHSNAELIKSINNAVKFIYNLLIKRIPGRFTAVDEDIAVTSSIITLPWDFGRLLHLKNEYGRPMFPVKTDQLVPTTATGSSRLYHYEGNTIVIEKTGLTKTFKITYLKKPRDIHMGQASAGAAASITLASAYAKKIADYYNGMSIENITKDWVDTIDDYTAARVATISETAAASDYYGIVPEIPEAFHHLIAPGAILRVKSISPVAQVKPTQDERNQYTGEILEALRAFGGPEQEPDFEDLFADFEPLFPEQGIIAVK
jgi:hypothetical protein